MISPPQKYRHTQGIILLVATTLIWGTTFPVIKDVVSSLSPASLIAIRFAVAALVFVPFAGRPNARLVRDGVLLGFVFFTSLTSQTIGMETISANRAGFIIGLNVILVPLFGPLLGQRVPVRAFFSAGLALIGIGVMSWEGGALGIGDLWMFVCALSYAIYILLLDAVTSRHPPMPLTAIQLITVALLGGCWAAPEVREQFEAISGNFNALLYLGLIGTAATTWTQAVAQRWVTAHETAVLYALEPVFAAIFSFLLLGETLGVRGWFGGGLVLTGMIMSQIRT
ncbi:MULTISPECIES: DMT family transporter [Nostoc]|uniref:DMT family transporter n=2 Tax=Nostoc TaxID=1177 RepID=A0ABR8ILF2_9NOSO|nr:MULTISPECIES: DMT family transporter [Nostoc]MBD2566019.1 DMT family transporter [Nostoc linckia FACHB-391]MBD2651626.1 DMT family transporter [Nostoc foliaceum FACHB-393]MBG1242064.1 DMT family transporter [Nostoc sp. NZL]